MTIPTQPLPPLPADSAAGSVSATDPRVLRGDTVEGTPHHSRSMWAAPPPWLCFAACLGLSFSIGCSKEQAQKLADDLSAKTKEFVDDPSKAVDSAKSAAQSAADSLSKAAPGLENVLPSDGEATINVGEAVEIGTALVRILPMGERGNVLQLRSYSKPEDEKFPSFLFQAQSLSTDLKLLSGQEVEGSLFFQAAKEGPVWSCEPNTPVKLAVQQIDEEGHLIATWSGNLRSSTGDVVQVQGSVKAKPAE